MKEKNKGALYIVATPIGNMGDITVRALEVLRNVDLVICEDTRTTRKILNSYGISARTSPYYSPQEKQLSGKYLNMLARGKTLALVSESGTPLISDPGYFIVKAARERKIPVIPVPGPSAFVAALSVSGIPADEVFFSGFLPKKKGKRKKFIEEHINKSYTFVFYESKYRIMDTIGFIKESAPGLMIFIAREITKKFEEFLRGTADEVYSVLSERENIKGEFVVVCSPSLK